MERKKIIQKIIDKISAKTYLEIGVKYGTVFLQIKVKRKIAIDPFFRIPFYKKLFFWDGILNAKYFKMTSDVFFDKYPSLFVREKIDTAFIDGLHTYRQSLKDVENCLRFLNERGVIIIHDCNPLTEAAAVPSRCGDVWKTIVYLRSQMSGLNAFVLDCDYGLGIVTKNRPENTLNFSKEEIDKMTFADLDKNRKSFLNLKRPEYLDEFLSNL